MNGWLLVRIAGIVVGIATLLRVATNEKLVTYDPLFLAWMDWLSDFVELGYLTKLIGPFLHWGIEQVRSFGVSIPDLQDEWRPAFVLSMLMFGAVSRHSGSWRLLVATPLGAFAISVWSGLTGSLVPVAFSALMAAAVAVSAVSWAIAGLLLSFTPTFLVFIPWAFGAFADLSAVTVAALVAVAALLFLFSGLVDRWLEGWRGIFAAASFNMGMDILGVMLGTLFLASWFANPPIW